MATKRKPGCGSGRDGVGLPLLLLQDAGVRFEPTAASGVDEKSESASLRAYPVNTCITHASYEQDCAACQCPSIDAHARSAA